MSLLNCKIEFISSWQRHVIALCSCFLQVRNEISTLLRLLQPREDHLGSRNVLHINKTRTIDIHQLRIAKLKHVNSVHQMRLDHITLLRLLMHAQIRTSNNVACLDQDIQQCCMQVQKSQEIKMAACALATLMQYVLPS